VSVQCRNVRVNTVFVNTASSSSFVHFGDGERAELTSRALAVQRAVPIFDRDEFRFASYAIFTRPVLKLPSCRETSIQTFSEYDIAVGTISVLGVSASSTFHVGCGGPHKAVTRIKHIRQFNFGPAAGYPGGPGVI